MGRFALTLSISDTLQALTVRRHRQARAAVGAFDQPVEHVHVLLSGIVGIAGVPLLIDLVYCLHLVEAVLVDDRLMLTVDDHDVRVIIIAARPAVRIPANFADVHGIAQDVVDRAVLPQIAARGADA